MLGLGVSGGIALWVSILVTPVLLRWLRKQGIGQPIREDGPASHSVKAGTPTMGGLAMVCGVVIGYAIGHLGTEIRFSRTGYLAVMAVVLFGIIGFLDDWIKVRHQRSLGLNKRAKFAAQVGFAVLFAELALHWAHTSTALSFTRSTIPGIDLGQVGWVVFAVLVMVGTSNAVNITDGVDGLAAGASTFCFAVLAIMGYWIFRHESIYHVLCLLLNLDLLLPIIGGLFVMETLSVIAQVVSFRVFHRRIFRMAPIHHHFELAGWPETTVIVRFWVLGGLFVAVGLGIFYADFLSVAKIT